MISIRLNGKIIDIDNTDLTILETLEKANIAANFQCRNGICGSCRCKLISGNIEYIKEPLAFTQPNEVLICIAKANSA